MFIISYFFIVFNFLQLNVFLCVSLDGIVKNSQLFDYVELVVEDNHLIEQKRFSGENSVSIRNSVFLIK